MIGLLWNICTGQFRARKIAKHYGLHHQFIIDYYAEIAQKLSLFPSSPPLTVTGFEILLRKKMHTEGRDLSKVPPLYCQGNDPLEPQKILDRE